MRTIRSSSYFERRESALLERSRVSRRCLFGFVYICRDARLFLVWGEVKPSRLSVTTGPVGAREYSSMRAIRSVLRTLCSTGWEGFGIIVCNQLCRRGLFFPSSKEFTNVPNSSLAACFRQRVPNNGHHQNKTIQRALYSPSGLQLAINLVPLCVGRRTCGTASKTGAVRGTSFCPSSQKGQPEIRNSGEIRSCSTVVTAPLL